MDEFKTVISVWFSLLVLIQSAAFMFSANDGRSVFRTYVESWSKTLRAVVSFFMPCRSAQECKKCAIIWTMVALCVPGAIAVLDFVSGITH